MDISNREELSLDNIFDFKKINEIKQQSPLRNNEDDIKTLINKFRKISKEIDKNSLVLSDLEKKFVNKVTVIIQKQREYIVQLEEINSILKAKFK